MRRLTLCFLGVLAPLLLTACGSSTITIARLSPAASIVISGDGDAINALKPKVQRQLIDSQTLVDGDKHSGDHFCGFTLKKNGHTYQVDAYGSVPTTTCSQTTQQSFAALLP